VKVAALTVLAMLAFAANSVMARLALMGGDADALGYTGVRLIAGALMLTAILYGTSARRYPGGLQIQGSWGGAAALLAYALAFSIAYLMLGAGTGALILFAAVQFGMLGWAVIKGDRPGVLEWAGIALAFAALAALLAPGIVAPNPLGAGLMILAGLSWASYTLQGRSGRSPLADTTGNFVRCLPAGVLLLCVSLPTETPTLRGAALAAASGALASGLGYAVWYAVLPSLTRTRAAFVQLTVPAIAAAGGALLLGEVVSPRLAACSAAILGGVALALLGGERRKARG
jgi:drug/metabolite transporter (DMT)-like permease